MKVRYTIINNAFDLECLKDSWQILEKGVDMIDFQCFKWNTLLIEEWLSFVCNKVFAMVYVFALIELWGAKLILSLVVQNKTVGIKWLGYKKDICFFCIELYLDYMSFIYSNVTYDLVPRVHKTFSGLNHYLDHIRDNTIVKDWCSEQNLQVHLTIFVPAEVINDMDTNRKSLSGSMRQNLRILINGMEKDNYKYELFIYKNIDDVDEYIYGLRDDKNAVNVKRRFEEKCSFYLSLFRGVFDFMLNAIEENEQLNKWILLVETRGMKLNKGEEETGIAPLCA